MKVIVILILAFVVSSSGAGLHTRKEHGRNRKHNNVKSTTKTTKNKHGKLQKIHDKIYKKYALMGIPGAAVEDNLAPSQGVVQEEEQQQQPTQQITMPVTRTSPEMIASYSPAQPTTLGSAEINGNTPQQIVSQPAPEFQQAPAQLQPATTQLQPAPAQLQPATTQLQPSDQAALQQDSGEQQTGVASVAPSTDTPQTTSVDPNLSAAGQSISLQDAGKGAGLKGLETYSGPLPETEQNKAEGVSPQEEVRVVNLGDDDQKAAQAEPCGGCPPGAKCVNGECQIREEAAQKLAAKGTQTNPESVNNIHNLETQELNTLLSEATKADPAPGTNPETGSPDLTTASPETAATTSPEATTMTSPEATTMTSPEATTTSPEVTTTSPEATAAFSSEPKQADATVSPAPSSSKPQQKTKAKFPEAEIRELREFARMYKMYQFIRKMEQKLNDPDCAPVCRITCQPFCPAKCCRQPHSKQTNGIINNAPAVGNITSSTDVTTKPTAERKLDAALIEDDSKDDDDISEQKKMNAARKHVFVRIAKNNELNKPRSDVPQRLN